MGWGWRVGQHQGAGLEWAGSCGRPKGQPAIQPGSKVTLREAGPWEGLEPASLDHSCIQALETRIQRWEKEELRVYLIQWGN